MSIWAQRKTREGDLVDLQVLHDLEVAGMGPDAVAAKHGLTRGKIAGLRHRTLGAVDQMPCLCIKPENKDGAMGPMWWA